MKCLKDDKALFLKQKAGFFRKGLTGFLYTCYEFKLNSLLMTPSFNGWGFGLYDGVFG